MPCYEVRTTSVEFQARNLELLKRAAEAAGWTASVDLKRTALLCQKGGQTLKIDLMAQTISGAISAAAVNGLKRAYSEAAIEEVARRKRWLLKKTGSGAGRMQLQKF